MKAGGGFQTFLVNRSCCMLWHVTVTSHPLPDFRRVRANGECSQPSVARAWVVVVTAVTAVLCFIHASGCLRACDADSNGCTFFLCYARIGGVHNSSSLAATTRCLIEIRHFPVLTNCRSSSCIFSDCPKSSPYTYRKGIEISESVSRCLAAVSVSAWQQPPFRSGSGKVFISLSLVISSRLPLLLPAACLLLLLLLVWRLRVVALSIAVAVAGRLAVAAAADFASAAPTKAASFRLVARHCCFRLLLLPAAAAGVTML